MDKQITLGKHAEEMIARLIAEGKVGSADEAIEEGLSLLEKRETKIAELREALIEGEESGSAEAFDVEEFLSSMNRTR